MQTELGFREATVIALMVGGPRDGEEVPHAKLYLGYNWLRYDARFVTWRDEYDLQGLPIDGRAIYGFRESVPL